MINSIGGMSKVKLTADELDACHEFQRLLVSCGKTQEQVGDECGVSQGQVWQWAKGHRSIPCVRAGAAAKAVGAKPEEISVEWKERVLPFIDLCLDDRPLLTAFEKSLIHNLRHLPMTEQENHSAEIYRRATFWISMTDCAASPEKPEPTTQ